MQIITITNWCISLSPIVDTLHVLYGSVTGDLASASQLCVRRTVQYTSHCTAVTVKYDPLILFCGSTALFHTAQAFSLSLNSVKFDEARNQIVWLKYAYS